jgi:deoxyribonuclease-4
MKKLTDLLGAHQSTGLGFAAAVSNAAECSAIQIFTGNNMSWRDRKISSDDIADFRSALKRSQVRFVVSHSIYLINMATQDPINRPRSRQALLAEIERCRKLGIEYFVAHPGSNPDSKLGISLIAEMIQEIDDSLRTNAVKLLLETTAGQGSSLGRSFEQLKEMQSRSKSKQVFFCLDTCHIFAAGYDLRNNYQQVMNMWDDQIGFSDLKVIHLNDSAKGFGQHKDRHAHIGQGEIGKEAFRKIMNDRRLSKIPKILETPKEEEWDKINLQLLRSFSKKR